MKTQTKTAKHTQDWPIVYPTLVAVPYKDSPQACLKYKLPNGSFAYVGEADIENANRLALCWNEHDQLIAQRDALREAASKVCQAVANCLPISGNGPVDTLYYKQKLMEIDKATGDLSFELTKINLCEPKD